MFDLKIDQNGDLTLLKNERKSSKIAVEFYITNTNAIKVNFELDGFSSKENKGITIKFDINNEEERYRFESLSNLDALKQACEIRLKTELGDMRNNTSIGSKMQSIIHKPLYDSFVIKGAEDLTKDAIYDILPNAQVTGEPIVTQSSKKYEQIMRLSIYDEDTIITYYDVR